MNNPSMCPLKIAVTGGGALLGQGILRALKRSSLPIHTISVDVNAFSAGLYWTDESYLVPKATDSAYLPAIQRLLATVKPDILLVGTDVELAPLATARASLEQDYRTHILVCSPEVVAVADDKYATSRFFHSHKFAAPGSAIVTTMADITNLVEEYGFPLIVKPRTGARSYGVIKVHNRQELQNALLATPNAVVQEFVGTEDGQEFTASGLYFDGRCDAAIVMRRDLRDGNTYRAFAVIDSVLEAQVKAWTQALQPYGPANFQFRIDRNGTPKVFEINARFSGTTPLRAYAGFYEVEMCIRKLIWNEPIVQPVIKPVTILRHWSETIIDPEQVASVTPI